MHACTHARTHACTHQAAKEECDRLSTELTLAKECAHACADARTHARTLARTRIVCFFFLCPHVFCYRTVLAQASESHTDVAVCNGTSAVRSMVGLHEQQVRPWLSRAAYMGHN